MESSLTKNQKDALYMVAQIAQVEIVHNRRDPELAWEVGFERHISHQGTRNALAKKSLVANDKLTLLGRETAKKLWTDAGDEGTWDHCTAKGVCQREEEFAQKRNELEAWRTYLTTLPVPESYQAPRAYGSRHIEWKTVEFAYAPTITVGDENSGFGADPEKGPKWRLSVSSGSQMNDEAAAAFHAALTLAVQTMDELIEGSK